MKLKTLNYIHNMLTENEKKHRNAMDIVYERRNLAEEGNTDNYQSLCELYVKVKNSWIEADEALADFESKEW